MIASWGGQLVHPPKEAKPMFMYNRIFMTTRGVIFRSMFTHQ